jgi:[ribosomal protein S5]-alanine N-acetyltransferase
MKSIKTKRLALRPLEIKYAHALYLIWSDWEVTKFTYVKNIVTPEDCLSSIMRLMDFRDKNDSIGPYVVSGDGAVIGFAGGMRQPSAVVEYDIFYHLAKTHWGKGYGTEIAYELLRLAFEEKSAEEVTATVAVVNKASWSLLEKVGLRRKGLKPSFFENKEGRYDCYKYAMTKEEFERITY